MTTRIERIDELKETIINNRDLDAIVAREIYDVAAMEQVIGDGADLIDRFALIIRAMKELETHNFPIRTSSGWGREGYMYVTTNEVTFRSEFSSPSEIVSRLKVVVTDDDDVEQTQKDRWDHMTAIEKLEAYKDASIRTQKKNIAFLKWLQEGLVD